MRACLVLYILQSCHVIYDRTTCAAPMYSLVLLHYVCLLIAIVCIILTSLKIISSVCFLFDLAASIRRY